jgi:hypothetical protein
MEALQLGNVVSVSHPTVTVTSGLAAATVATIVQSAQVDAETEGIGFP